MTVRRSLACALLVSLLVGVAWPAAASGGSLTFSPAVPCFWACPDPDCDEVSCGAPVVGREAGCAPVPLAAPGTYAEERLLVPMDASSLDAYLQSDAGAFVAFACRVAPDARGSLVLDAQWSAVCGAASPLTNVCAGIMLPESAHLAADVASVRGEMVILRVYNVLAVFDVHGEWFMR